MPTTAASSTPSEATCRCLFVAQQWAVGEDIADEGVEGHARSPAGNDLLPQAMADELRRRRRAEGAGHQGGPPRTGA